MLPSEFGPRIAIHDGRGQCALPDWAASLIWLGSWCRVNQVEGKRLVVFTVLPTRDFAGAFAGLGSLMSGAAIFKDSLAWPVFRKQPIGSNVFWAHESSGTQYCGNIVGFYEDQGSEFITLRVTKAAKKSNIGTTWNVNKRSFGEYHFTQNKPPSVSKSKLYDAAEQALGTLVTGISPKWIWSDEAECLLVTSVNSFESSNEAISLSIDGGQPIVLTDLLCIGRNRDKSHAKLRVDHPRGAIDGSFPLVILDGSRAFSMSEHFYKVRNMLIILDRLEYQTDIHDAAKTLRSLSSSSNSLIDSSIPDSFVPGIEIAAYLIDDV